MKKEAKHTPGPWFFGKNEEHNIQMIRIGNKEGDVMTFTAGGTPEQSEISEANAKLIAAAPELLEASIAVYEALKATQNSRDFECPALYSAIKKATGFTKL